ncbi:MAG: LysR family transcriptional regulator [Papillibacter sp.]|nr:LysR family transcriptional regulator [Papillibacter sp.]
MYNFTNQQILMFLAVAEHHSLSDAAKSVFVSQPSLSKTIKKLESNLGVKLFERNAEGISLTREGEYLYYYFKSSLNSITTAIERAKNMQKDNDAVLNIGCYRPFSYSQEFNPIKKLLNEYAEENSGVQLLINWLDYSEIRRLLLSDSLDLVFSMSYALKGLPETESLRLIRTNWLLLVPHNHPLAEQEELSAEKFSNETFLFVSPKESQTAKRLDLERCLQAGFTPGRILYLHNFDSVVSAVASGKGLALCAGTINAPEGIKAFSLPELPSSPYISAAWKVQNIKAEAKMLIEHLNALVS